MGTYNSKRLFYGIHRSTIFICNAVSQFNDGAKGRATSYSRNQKNQNIQVRKVLLLSQVTTKYKKSCQMMRSLNKKKSNQSDRSYILRAFSYKLTPKFNCEAVVQCNVPVVKILS